jgi:hypothetical protein
MYTRSLGLTDCNGDGPVVNERLNAKLSEDTAATAELRQVFKELHTDYGKRSDTELEREYRTSLLADAVYALELRVAALA